jgi:hypothetical protein
MDYKNQSYLSYFDFFPEDVPFLSYMFVSICCRQNTLYSGLADNTTGISKETWTGFFTYKIF